MGTFWTAEEHGYVGEGIPDDGERCLPADFRRSIESTLVEVENVRPIINSRCYMYFAPSLVIRLLLLS